MIKRRKKKIVSKHNHVNAKRKKGKGKGGRPSKFKTEYIEQGRLLCEVLGANDVALARFFKVNEDTIGHWKKAYPEFSHALKMGKDLYDVQMVEKRLLHRALGYGYKEIETSIETLPGKKGEKATVKETVRVKRKRMAPDVNACIFWLCNRDRRRWNNKHHIAGAPEGITQNNTFVKIDELNLSLTEKKLILAQIRKEKEVLDKQNALPGNSK